MISTCTTQSHPTLSIFVAQLLLFQIEGEYDFTMRIYNSDGSEPEMCGNGIRCFAQFLKDLGEDGKLCAQEVMYDHV